MVQVPEGATTGLLIVETVEALSRADRTAIFNEFVVAPTVTDVFPSSGPPGTKVTITGTNFTGHDPNNPNSNAFNVAFGTTMGSIVEIHNRNELRAVVPSLPSGEYPVLVENQGGTSQRKPGDKARFKVPSPVAPTITDISPRSGTTGTRMVIAGTSFGSGVQDVQLNDMHVPFTLDPTNSTIMAVVPAGATSGPVTVTTSVGKVTSAIIFTAMQPVSKVALSASPSTASIPAGQNASFRITLDRSNYTGAVKLSLSDALPAGATASFDSDVVTGSTAMLTVKTSLATPAATIKLIVNGTAEVAVEPVSLTLTTIAAPTVTLSMMSAAMRVIAGQSASYGIALDRKGFTGPVDLRMGALPTGVSAIINGNPATGDSASATFVATESAPAGIFSFTIMERPLARSSTQRRQA